MPELKKHNDKGQHKHKHGKTHINKPIHKTMSRSGVKVTQSISYDFTKNIPTIPQTNKH